MRTLKKILLRELEFIKQESSLFALIILAPFFFAFFYSSVYVNKVETNINIIVVDEDKSELSRTFTRYLDAHQQLAVYSNSINYNDAKALLQKDEIPAFIFISRNFEKEVKSSKGFTIPLFINNTRFLTSNDINKAVNEVAATMSAGIKLKYLQSGSFSSEQSFAQIEPINIDIRALYNYTESYGDFVIPGLLALILQQTLLIGISLSFTKEIEEAKTKELYILSGNSFYKGVFLKGIIYLILFIVISFFFYTVIFSLFSISSVGNFLILSAVTFFYLTTTAAFGFFLSTFIKKKIASLQFFAFTSIPFFLASGYSWPKSAIPDFINWIMYLVPSTTYLNSFVGITQKGQTWEENILTILVLLTLTAVYFTAGIHRFKKFSSPLNSWD